MLIQKDFLNQLRDFGLNTYESRLWTALLSRGVATAGELSDIADVPRSRTYDVLESLEKKGFIIMKLDKPIKYVAVSPDHVLERVRKKILEEADNQTKLLTKLQKSPLLEELKNLHMSGAETIEPFEMSGTLKGRKNLYNHLEFVIKSAQKSVVIFTTQQGLVRKKEFLKPAIKRAKEQGANVMVAAPLSQDFKTEIKELSKYAEIRNTDVSGRFCIVDGKEIVFMLLGDEDINPAYDVGVWITSEFFASTLQKLFEMAWQGMKPYKDK